ncbi:hypothetical protein AMJ85_10235, partial [candidate division BRC1 bacterium SM23_51]
GLWGCDGLIRNNRIVSNVSDGRGGGGGAGLFDCDGTIENNTITSNSARPGTFPSDGRGGGLCRCDGIIQNNEISGNSSGGIGGGLYDCNGTIRNNKITANMTDWGGGLSRCDGIIANNIIAGNLARGLPWSPRYGGGGLFRCNGAIVNNTIVGNTGILAGALSGCDGATITCCVIWDNWSSQGTALQESSIPSYSCIQEWAGGGFGNISAAPMFVDPDGPDDNPDTYRDNDYRLAVGSPCIDAGNPDPECNDACLPPGLGTERNDMGVFGGPRNYGWLAVGPHSPDLTGALVNISLSPVIGGQPIALAGNVLNQGELPSFSYAWVEFWAIDRKTSWTGYLCESIFLGPLGVGGSFDLADIAPPRVAYDNIPYGVYAIEMRIDATDIVAEWNEANNSSRWQSVIIMPDRANLVTIGFDFSPQDVSPDGGTTITFSGIVQNTGSQPTTASFWVEFRVWPNPLFNPDGPYLCDSYFVTQSLGPGEGINLATLPARSTYALAPGVYYVGIRLDPLDEVTEQREGDNLSWLIHKKLYVGPRPTAVSIWSLYR